MKKTVSVILLLCIVVSVFAGCGGAASSSSAQSYQQAPAAASEVNGPMVGSESSAASAASSEAAISGEEVTLRFAWQLSGQARELVYEEACREFMELYPNVKIEIETAESGKYAAKIAMDVSANNTPDIFTFWRPEPSYGTDKYIDAGAIADLTDLLADPYFSDMFDDYSITTMSYNGVPVALPENYAFIIMLANTEVLTACGLEVPTTWDEWIASMQVIKDAGYYPWGISTKAFASGWERPLGYTLDRYLGSFGDTGVLEAFGGRAPFNSPEALEACKKLFDLCAGNSAPDSMTLDDTQATAKYYNTGRAAYWCNGTYGIASIDPAIQEVSVPMVFPEIPGAPFNQPILDKDVTGGVYLHSGSWEDSAKKPVLIELCKLLYSDKYIDKVFYEANNLLPIKGFQMDPNIINPLIIKGKALADVSEQVKWPLGRANPENKEPFYSVYTDFWSGKYTGEEFSAQLQEIFFGK